MVLRPRHATLPSLPRLDSRNHIRTHRRHGCLVSDKSLNAKIRHLQPWPSTHCPNRPPKLTKLAPAMPANGAANDTKPSAPPPSKHLSKTRRMNPQLLVQPLAQYRTPASQKNTTAPKLPRTLSITSVPCLPNPHRLIQRPHQSPSPIPPYLPMPFGPPTPLLIPAPVPPWSSSSSNWARTANSGLQLPRVKSVALLKATNRTYPLVATRCTLRPSCRLQSHVLTHRCSHQDAQGRNAPHPLHRWRRPHRLQRQSQPSYR